ncbi:cytochrome P450 [Boletus edulis BED1]|uniref:Cytochrome P450 n=1 Tax=Boletus edulis BED1 TaxID=1328754 RepID=A0AAD4GD53_BOLED|nr:cytochrome P450 [Boletus edulis BED1]
MTHKTAVTDRRPTPSSDLFRCRFYQIPPRFFKHPVLHLLPHTMDVFTPTSFYRWAASAIALVVIKFVVDKALLIRRAFASTKDCPGQIPLWFSPFSAMTALAGDKFPGPGMPGYYAAKFSLYKKFGATNFASVDLLQAQPIFWLADPEALKIVTSDRHTFQKDITQYEILNFCGGNLISLEGTDWKRHRSVSMSAFNEANIALVWSEALRIINEWFEQLDAVGSDVSVDLLLPMGQITLHVIATAGFGGRVSWTADPTVLTFRSAFMDSVHNTRFRMLTPGWFYRLSSLITVPYLSSRALRTQLAFDELRTHMLDLVASARAETMSGDYEGKLGTALLRNLVEANMNQDGASKKLSEGELLSNVFLFFLAGHETTAHSLCFALVLLALYPDYQEKIYKEVIRIWPSDIPVAQLTTNHKEYMDKLEYTTACIRETLRMFPPVTRLLKDALADAVLPGAYFAPGFQGSPVKTGDFSMAVPAGSLVVIDIWALHHNSLYWGEDVTKYKPERFIDTEAYEWPRNAFMPFMAGPRSCIGHRFALAEMVGIIASIVRRYEIRVPDNLAKEPLEVQKEALLKWTTGLTLTPVNARVKLCRRV